jgi:hypothetical protein
VTYADQPADPEPQPELGVETADTPDLLVTTTSTKDYLNRSLVNAVPGTSQATDYLGRSVVAGNKDFIGRNLVA